MRQLKIVYDLQYTIAIIFNWITFVASKRRPHKMTQSIEVSFAVVTELASTLRWWLQKLSYQVEINPHDKSKYLQEVLRRSWFIKS